MMTRLLGKPINRKQIQRIFRKMSYITSSKSKKKLYGQKYPNVRAYRPNQVLEAELTYLHCDIDRWVCLFKVFIQCIYNGMN